MNMVSKIRFPFTFFISTYFWIFYGKRVLDIFKLIKPNSIIFNLGYPIEIKTLESYVNLPFLTQKTYIVNSLSSSLSITTISILKNLMLLLNFMFKTFKNNNYSKSLVISLKTLKRIVCSIITISLFNKVSSVKVRLRMLTLKHWCNILKGYNKKLIEIINNSSLKTHIVFNLLNFPIKKTIIQPFIILILQKNKFTNGFKKYPLKKELIHNLTL